MKRRKSTWIVEDTEESSQRIDKISSHVVSSEQTQKKRAKRKGENNVEAGKSSAAEQGLELRKKKQNKRKKAKKIKAVDNSDGNKERCMDYLKRWHEDRQNWKFEKLRQIWLFRNMLDPAKMQGVGHKVDPCAVCLFITTNTVTEVYWQVPDSSFEILVDYISGTQGHARQIIVEKTMKVVKAMELWSKLSEEGVKEEDIAIQIPDGKVPEVMYERARSILQSLDDV